MIKNGTSNERSENGIQQNLTLTSSNKRSNATNSTIGSWGYRLDVDWQIGKYFGAYWK